MGSPREMYVEQAKLTEQAALYDDMVKYMEMAASVGGELNKQERNLLARSIHHATALRRKSCRILSSTERSAEVRSDPALAHAAKEYKNDVEDEMCSTCNRFISLINSKCITTDCTADEKVLYNMLKGDLNRHLGDNGEDYINFVYCYNALSAYKESQGKATLELDEMNPARVHIELTSALYKYRILTEGGDRSVPTNGDVIVLVKEIMEKLTSVPLFVQEE